MKLFKKIKKKFAEIKKSITFAPPSFRLDSWSVRLGVRTPGFHPGNRGSIPLRTTNIYYTLTKKLWQTISQQKKEQDKMKN